MRCAFSLCTRLKHGAQKRGQARGGGESEGLRDGGAAAVRAGLRATQSSGGGAALPPCRHRPSHQTKSQPQTHPTPTARGVERDETPKHPTMHPAPSTH